MPLLLNSGPEWVDEDEEDDSGTAKTPSEGENDENRGEKEKEPGPSNAQPPQEGKKPKSPAQIIGMEMVKTLVNVSDGLACDIQDALHNLLFKDKKAKKPFPWKVALEIGPDVKINAVGYIKVWR